MHKCKIFLVTVLLSHKFRKHDKAVKINVDDTCNDFLSHKTSAWEIWQWYQMKMYEDTTNVHCLYSFHDKVWTNEMESKMWNWTWTFYFLSNNRVQIMKSKYNAFSGIVALFHLFQFWMNYSYKLCFVTYSRLLFLKINIKADQI